MVFDVKDAANLALGKIYEEFSGSSGVGSEELTEKEHRWYHETLWIRRLFVAMKPEELARGSTASRGGRKGADDFSPPLTIADVWERDEFEDIRREHGLNAHSTIRLTFLTNRGVLEAMKNDRGYEAVLLPDGLDLAEMGEGDDCLTFNIKG